MRAIILSTLFAGQVHGRQWKWRIDSPCRLSPSHL